MFIGAYEKGSEDTTDTGTLFGGNTATMTLAIAEDLATRTFRRQLCYK
jgi:hypothetical protein